MTAGDAPRPSVLVLAGGPDAERPVSIASATEVASALKAAGHEASLAIIDTPSLDELAKMPGDVVFPVLHGPWGEGGPLQLLLESLGRPFVGSGPDAAALAMDKLATSRLAECIPSVRIPLKAIVDPARDEPPAPFPFVVKPRAEGSSVGLHFCRVEADWPLALASIRSDAIKAPRRGYIAEQCVTGREVTVAVLDGRAQPIIEIAAASGVYDYAAKYDRSDTRYILDPDLPDGLSASLAGQAEAVCAVVGVRHLARVDFLVDARGAWLLEVNTLPGFTTHSLFPMACAHARLAMPELCSKLVRLAIRDA